mmetsp:Transcript_34748/g.66064  ORF Transcript_34748/g.66064 Transcript_34748/m.66064 type:complete len:458 (+) Transcript_34748:556-1929(+)
MMASATASTLKTIDITSSSSSRMWHDQWRRSLSIGSQSSLEDTDDSSVIPQVISTSSLSDSEDSDEDLSPSSSSSSSSISNNNTPILSLSEALKTGTQESHTAAENVHFVHNFLQGKIDRHLYTHDFLSGLYHTYVALEGLLDLHAPLYFGTVHFPKELSRVEALREDMEYWHGVDWERKVECGGVMGPSPAVEDYIRRMTEMGSRDPRMLLSHAYTRYLGDLSGGKVMARIARRALHLGKGWDGLRFYQFEHVASAKLFKDRYRQALDEMVLGGGEVGRLVAEANVAFALNMRVFEELDVKGGVVGAKVRHVGEALAYYDRYIVEERRKCSNERGGIRSFSLLKRSASEEAKCPFGFKGGSNPHLGEPSVSKDLKGRENNDHDGASKEDTDKSSSSRPFTSKAVSRSTHTMFGGGRCPWPFVFLHDPTTGMRDWQTWLVIGVTVCSCWGHVNAATR